MAWVYRTVVTISAAWAVVALHEDCPAEELDTSLLQRKLTLEGSGEDYSGEKYRYGKYFRMDPTGWRNYESNSLWVFQPKNRGSEKLPLVVQFRGGAFCLENTNAASERTAFSDAANEHGFVFIRVAYRSLTLRYHYLSRGEDVLEEFVQASEDGSMWLDQNGLTYHHQNYTLGYFEAVPKAAWDGVTGLEFIIKNAEELGVDVNQMSFIGESAGTGIANYLTWIYWQQHQQRFTVKALGFKVPQLNYPNPPHTQKDLQFFIDSSTKGESAKLSDYFDVEDFEACNEFGNVACEAPLSICEFEYKSCNPDWHESQMASICKNLSLQNVTLKDASLELTWDPSNVYGHALRKFWYHADNMRDAENKNVYVYALTMYNGSSLLHTAHHAVFSEAYAKVASAADIPYVAYYPDVKYAKPEFRTSERYRCKQEVGFITNDFVNEIVEYNYKSNFGWRSHWNAAPEGIDDTWNGTTGEFIAFMEYALGRSTPRKSSG